MNMRSIKPLIKVPLVLLENITFTIFPSSRKCIEKFVFNPYSFGQSHLDYSIQQYKSFSDKISPNEIKDQVLLELGPGGSIGFGLLALSAGVKKYFAIEDGNHTRFTPQTIEIYKEKLLNGNQILSNQCFTGDGYFNTEKIEFIENNQTSSYALPDNSVDLIYSCAVLEHVHNLDLCFSEMTRVLRPGGIMNHQVDLRDHIFSQKSIWFLTISNNIFSALFSKTGEYVNRKRLSYYKELFKKNRLQILSLDKTIVFKKGLTKKLLKQYSEDDLRTLSINVTLKKL